MIFSKETVLGEILCKSSIVLSRKNIIIYINIVFLRNQLNSDFRFGSQKHPVSVKHRAWNELVSRSCGIK